MIFSEGDNIVMIELEKSSDLQYIQKNDLDLMITVKKIFLEHKLEYNIIAGTLLGSVRHNGFIPWDDDVDFAMPRQDYNKFVNQMNEWLPEGYFAENFKTNEQFKYYITRVYKSGALIKELRGENGGTDTLVSIDIFPFDGTPNNVIFRWIFVKLIMALRMLASFSNRGNIDRRRKRNLFESLCIKLADLIKLDKYFSSRFFYNIIDKILNTQNYEKSVYVGSLMGAYREKELVKKSWLSPSKEYNFSGEKFMGPRDFDSYLKHMYGDYMKIPSQEEIIKKKHFEIKR